MAPPSGNVSRPGRALAGLATLIVVLFLAIVGSNIASPGQWGKDFKVHLGLDLTSGTTVAYMPAVVRTRCPGRTVFCMAWAWRCLLRWGRIMTK